MAALKGAQKGFNFVVIDPPWSNKSVQRGSKCVLMVSAYRPSFSLSVSASAPSFSAHKWLVEKRYESLGLDEIEALPVKHLLSDKEPTVVLCWVTNKLEYQRFVLDRLFPAWNVTYSTSWIWLKVKTDLKTPVCPLTGTQRKPYEILMIGTRNMPKPIPVSLSQTRVIATTPATHSRKPPIHRSSPRSLHTTLTLPNIEIVVLSVV